LQALENRRINAFDLAHLAHIVLFARVLVVHQAQFFGPDQATVAARETGAALRVGADWYADAESRAVAALR
jgi:hypothetical protein